MICFDFYLKDQSLESIWSGQDWGREEDERVVITVPDPPSQEDTMKERLPIMEPQEKLKILSRIRSLILELKTSSGGRDSDEMSGECLSVDSNSHPAGHLQNAFFYGVKQRFFPFYHGK